MRNQIGNVNKNSKYHIGIHVEGNLEVYVYEMSIRMDMKISYKRRNTCFTRCIHLQVFLNFC